MNAALETQSFDKEAAIIVRPDVLSDEHFVATLHLADGSALSVSALDEETFLILTCLASTMQLELVPEHSDPSLIDRVKAALAEPVTATRLVAEQPRKKRFPNKHALFILTSHNVLIFNNGRLEEFVAATYPSRPSGRVKTAIWDTRQPSSDHSFVSNLIQISLAIAQYAQCCGGLLLHGALAEKNGVGVMLAGPGRAGKTTASQRLPLPWRSLSDDMTLLVRDDRGTYWCHPWPTWSSFLFAGTGGTWDVQYAVPLKGIFFLKQAQQEEISPLGAAQTVCLLTELAEQAWQPMSRRIERNKAQFFRLERFDNICAIAKAIPSHVLRLSRHGAFWQGIEKAFDG